MSFELILPFLRPIEPLLLDDKYQRDHGQSRCLMVRRRGDHAGEATISFDVGKLRAGLEVMPTSSVKSLPKTTLSHPLFAERLLHSGAY